MFCDIATVKRGGFCGLVILFICFRTGMCYVACFGPAGEMFSLIVWQVAENDWSLWVTSRLSGIELRWRLLLPSVLTYS